MPLTDADVVKFFGDPASYVRQDGTISERWPDLILDAFPLPGPLPLSYGPGVARRVSCHRRIRPYLESAIRAVYLLSDAWNDLDDYAGCYAWRAQRRAHVLSRHAWAIAVDFDAHDNPFGSPPHMHPATVAIFERWGFEWGGTWKAPRTDGMHFEFVDVARLEAA